MSGRPRWVDGHKKARMCYCMLAVNNCYRYLAGETTPLVTTRPSLPIHRRGVIRSFLVAVSPIDVDEWKTGGILSRAYAIFKVYQLSADFLIKFWCITTALATHQNLSSRWDKKVKKTMTTTYKMIFLSR